jgi:predicted GNAT family acetyltransferase
LRVVPLCPFIAGYIGKHAEYADLVDHDALAALS